MKKVLKIGIVSVVVLLFVTVWLHRLEEQAGYADSTPIPEEPIRVGVVAAEPGAVSLFVYGEGVASAIRKSHLQFEEPGKVVFLASDGQGGLIREGSRVTGPTAKNPGMLLARIDVRDKKTAINQSSSRFDEARKELEVQVAILRQARIDLADAKRDLVRKRKLFETKVIAGRDLDQAKTRYDRALAEVSVIRGRVSSAKARLSSARASMLQSARAPEKLTIRAPFDGIIARLNIREGDYFDPGSVDRSTKALHLETAPITIIDPVRMDVVLNVPAHDGRHVRAGQAVDVHVDADVRIGSSVKATRVNGFVHAVSPQVDGSRRTVRVTVRITQADTVLQDGMFVSCRIHCKVKEVPLRIPLATLLHKDGHPYVYVIRKGQVWQRNVELGIRDGAHAEVLSGLARGDRIVSTGRLALSEGIPVTPVQRN